PIIDWMKHKPIYIADGHHRYTTALQFQKEEMERNGGKLPPAHPANWCMFVLVGMQDDGLLILPTHRLIGGLSGFDIQQFGDTISDAFDVSEMMVPPERMPEAVERLANDSSHSFALYEGTQKRLYQLRLKNPDVLRRFEPTHSDAWR